jgi:hypothetical protein
MPQVELSNFTAPPEDKKTLSFITKGNDKNIKRINNIAQTSFWEDRGHKKNMLIYRAQYQGIDPYMNQVYGHTPGDPSQARTSKVASRLAPQVCNILGARLYGEFMSPHGDHVVCMPKKNISEATSQAATNLMNYYFHQDDYFETNFRKVFTQLHVNGCYGLRLFWNYELGTYDKIINQAATFDILNNTPTLGTTRIERKNIELADRPQIVPVDPLFFGLLKGSATVNGQLGSPMSIEKRLFTRAELYALEDLGYISGFKNLKKDKIGEMQTGRFEPTEISKYYKDLFNSEMNRGLDWDDPYHRYWVDVIYEDGTSTTPIMEYWFINGNAIRAFTWEGGFKKPYEFLQFVPTETTWVGIGAIEMIQDHVREANIIAKKRSDEIVQAGKSIIAIARESGIDQTKLQKMYQEGTGGIITVDTKSGTLKLDEVIKQFTLGIENSKLAEYDELNRQGAFRTLGISFAEDAGSPTPSAVRSANLFAGLSAQSSRPAQMVISTVGEGLRRIYEMTKTMIYMLQDEPVEVLLDEENPRVLRIPIEDIQSMPDMIAMPNAAMKELTAETQQGLLQMLPVLLQAGYDVGKFASVVLELGFNPEIKRRAKGMIIKLSPEEQTLQAQIQMGGGKGITPGKAPAQNAGPPPGV